MSKTTLFIAIVGVQGVIALFLLYRIFSKPDVFGTAISVAPMSKELLKENVQSRLKHYYEPAPNSTIRDPDWSKLYHGEYRINGDSLREDQEYSVDKDADVFRIIALGDSWTYGLFVDGDNIWPEFLERKLNDSERCNVYEKYEVINLGFPGYDIQYGVERFRLRGQKYDPDLVIWLLKDDDFLEMRDRTSEKEAELIQEMKASGEYDALVKEGVPYPQAEKMYKFSLELRDEVGTDTFLQQQEEYFNEIFNYYDNKLVVMNLYIKDPKMLSILSRKVKEREMAVLSEFSNVTKIPDASFIPDDYHPTAKGHELLAEELFNQLYENNIIPCEE
ncbi:SGNH/GDSL hydrolase family protein [Candidatus Roizmanbacteria bacterium]|nr:MAG: SGNH/GDSL hydrolase family protein [Candidatus Roizmanbacteria bacterium]